MSVLVIGDLHFKYKEPFYSATKEFLEELKNNREKNQKLIFLGDVFDSNTPHWQVYSDFKDFLLTWPNDVFIVSGNHTLNSFRGSALNGLHLLKNVHVAFKEEIWEIENKKFLALPHQLKDFNYYSEIEGTFDYVVSHVTHPKEAFANEGIDLSNIDCNCFIYGHTHISNKYKVKEQDHIILGVPLVTRHGEQLKKKRLLNIQDDDISYIDLKDYVEYEDVVFGNFPKNDKAILNIIGAPNPKLVQETYKDYYVRDSGIKLLEGEDIECLNIDIDSNSINKRFVKWAKEKGISTELIEISVDCISEVL